MECDTEILSMFRRAKNKIYEKGNFSKLFKLIKLFRLKNIFKLAGDSTKTYLSNPAI